MESSEHTQEKKVIMRKKLTTQRAKISPEKRSDYAQSITAKILQLPEIIAAETIFIYISYGTEVNTHKLIKKLLTAEKKLFAPHIINPNCMQAIPFHNWADLHPGPLGILTPAYTKNQPQPFDISITPGLGFTTSGHRIGYGRGYYDKWFCANPVKNKIALAFEAQLADNIPIEKNDIYMDKIITEQRTIIASKNTEPHANT